MSQWDKLLCGLYILYIKSGFSLHFLIYIFTFANN